MGFGTERGDVVCRETWGLAATYRTGMTSFVTEGRVLSSDGMACIALVPLCDR